MPGDEQYLDDDAQTDFRWGDFSMEITEFERRLVFQGEGRDIIQELRQEQLPLVLWGAGDVAGAVKQHLELHGIIPSAVLVDHLEEHFEFEGIPAVSLKKIKELFPEFDVIVGHSHMELGEALKDREAQVRNVYYPVSVCYEQYEKISQEFVKEHLDDYYHTYQLLEDEESRRAMAAYLNSRMNNDIQYVKNCYTKEQTYFCNDLYQIGRDETYADIGAFDGDSIRLFLKSSDGGYRHIYALEADPVNFSRLQKYTAEQGLQNLTLYRMAAWKEKADLHFNGTGKEKAGVSSAEKADAQAVAADALDHLIGSETVTMLKINFLYGVLETLMGARALLKRSQPKLAVVVGFDEWALIRIPQYIHQQNPNYRFWLRYNSCMPARLTLYAK